jgi:iron complex transport system substrate-binding protein
MYGVAAENSAVTAKLRNLGIPYLYLGDYTEESPLGKAEWLFAISEIVGCRERGVEAFREAVERYTAVKANVSRGGNAPKVMFNLPYQDVWYMPSDESYMVQLVEDAGGEYVYKGRNTTRGSVAINLEEAYLLVADADVWINVGQCSTMEELQRAAPHFMATSVVERGEVYNNNRRRTAAGGSDFWESAIVRPDVVLAELAAIMSGEACEPCYYQQLQ